MNIFNRLKKFDASNRINEEIFYAQALREIESGLRRDGLWAQALSESGMDQSKAAAKYIKLRVQSLKDENDLATVADQEKRKVEAKAMEEKRDRDAPIHPGCGGVIDRSQIGSSMNWKCRKCKKIGSFKISS